LGWFYLEEVGDAGLGEVDVGVGGIFGLGARALVGFEKRVYERVREVDTILCFWWFAQV
jgi:hypothetical protein